jgi:hypothetical protein
VSTLCNQEAGQSQNDFLGFSENRLRNSRLKVFFRVGTLPDYDKSGNTDTAPRNLPNHLCLWGWSARGTSGPDELNRTNPGRRANKKVRCETVTAMPFFNPIGARYVRL